MKKLLAVASLALVLIVSACSSDSSGPTEPEEPTPEELCTSKGGVWLYPGETASWGYDYNGIWIDLSDTNTGTRPRCSYRPNVIPV